MDLTYPSPAYGQAVELLRLCWRSIDADYKSRYRRDIWSQVEERCQLAARTVPTLTAWVERFLRFPHTEIRDPAGLVGVVGVADAREVLRIFREEPTVIVAFLRAAIESEREEVSA